MGLTKGQIQILHVAKGKLGLDDDTYRDVLEAHGGVRSSLALDFKGFSDVMKHFEACGFKRLGGGKSGRQKKERPGMATEKQIRKIYALWWSLGESYYTPGKELQALRGFLKKRFRVDHENFLRWKTASAVIEAIKAIGARQEL